MPPPGGFFIWSAALNEQITEDQVADEQESVPAYDLERLNAFGQVLSAKRSEAMRHRASSGIEEEWQEDEDHYESIDDANRPEKESKPQGNHGGSSGMRRAPTNGTRSTVFVPITAPFVDFAAARAADILLPTDDRGFIVELSPLPDVEEVVANKDQTPVSPDGTTAADAGAKMLETLKDGAKRAQRRIDDWLAECGYNAETRQVIHDSAKIGSGVLKGPFAGMKKATRANTNPLGLAVIEMIEEIQPKSKRISAWDLFPDPACGECIHNGSHIFERDRMPARNLAELKKLPGYIADAIDIALQEGPNKKYENERDHQKSDCDQYEVWYFHGFVTPEELQAAGESIEEMAPNKQVPVTVTMVNDRVIRCVEAPLESGCFPYDIMPWSKRVGSPWGTGVSRQMRTPQRMVNAATRAMLDNAGRSSAPQLVIDRNLIVPADGKWEITPGKQWWVTEEGANGDVRKAFVSIDIPSNQEQLQNIINFALEMAERVTGIPLLAQGQQGAATQTVGGMTLLDRNSNTPLRMIARNFDDKITVPHIQRYYEWLLLYGTDPREKANFNIIARGSSVLFEKDAQAQAMMAMGQFVINPAFEKSPKRWMDEVLRAQRIDPESLDLTEDEKQRIAEQQAAMQQQGDPRMAAQKEVAMIRADTEKQKATMNAQSDMAELRFKADEAERQRQHESALLQMELQQDMMQFMREEGMSFEELKASLAETTLKLRVQKELSMRRNSPQVANPPSEPAGRAEPGRAYEQ